MHENILLYVQYLSAKFGIFRGEGPLQIARVSQSVSQTVSQSVPQKVLTRKKQLIIVSSDVLSCLYLATCNLQLATCKS